MKNSSLLILAIVLSCIVTISQEEPTKLAVTLYGANSKGYPADYPASVRERASSLRPGESLLMTPQEYKTYHAQKAEQYKDVIRTLQEDAERFGIEASLRESSKRSIAELDDENLKLRAVIIFLLREIKVSNPNYNIPSKAKIVSDIRTIIDSKNAD